MIRIFSSFLVFVAVIANSLWGAELEENIDRATALLRYVKTTPGKSIPQSVLRDAQGLAIVSIVKGGLIVSGRAGTGLVMAKTSKGWSAPSAIGLIGAGLGAQIGAEAADLIIVINTKEALQSFAEGKALFLSAELSAIAGLHGKKLEKGFIPSEATRTYCFSKGLFAGISIEGTVILERKDANAQFYGKSITSEQLLSGAIPPPVRAQTLYQELAISSQGGILYNFFHSYIFFAVVAIAGLLLIWFAFKHFKK
jgi:lipid-binding SYLF domain-containing protein